MRINYNLCESILKTVKHHTNVGYYWWYPGGMCKQYSWENRHLKQGTYLYHWINITFQNKYSLGRELEIINSELWFRHLGSNLSSAFNFVLSQANSLSLSPQISSKISKYKTRYSISLIIALVSPRNDQVAKRFNTIPNSEHSLMFCQQNISRG